MSGALFGTNLLILEVYTHKHNGSERYLQAAGPHRHPRHRPQGRLHRRRRPQAGGEGGLGPQVREEEDIRHLQVRYCGPELRD